MFKWAAASWFSKRAQHCSQRRGFNCSLWKMVDLFILPEIMGFNWSDHWKIHELRLLKDFRLGFKYSLQKKNEELTLVRLKPGPPEWQADMVTIAPCHSPLFKLKSAFFWMEQKNAYTRGASNCWRQKIRTLIRKKLNTHYNSLRTRLQKEHSAPTPKKTSTLFYLNCLTDSFSMLTKGCFS